jgi:cobalt/nickel transport system permease protein
LPVRRINHFICALAGFGAGVTGIGFGALFVAAALISTGEEFINVAKVVIFAHLPVMLIEGIITSFCIIFLKKVKPEILEVNR